MFNFLNPAILIGLVAGLIPLIIHLLNRRKVREIQFSSIHFLKQMARKEMRRLKIRQILLLIIRTLIILLIILAFARPTLQGTNGFLGEKTSSEVVVIIDNSLSLNSLELTGNLLEKVRQRWINLEAAFKTGDRITVLLGTNPLKILADRESYSANLWEKIAKEIQPSYLTGNLNSAILKAREFFHESNLYNKELYLLSDFQSSGFREADLKQISSDFDEKIRVFCLPVYHGNEENISVDTASVMNQLVEVHQDLNIEAILKNQHPENHLSSLISLVLEGKRVAQKNISLEPGKSESLKFQNNLRNSGFISGFVECESDAVLEDNRYYFNFFVPRDIKILHLVKHPDRESFVPLILKPAIDRGLFDYEKRAINEISGIDLFSYKSVIIEGINEFPQSLIVKLQQYSRRDFGLIIIPAENSAIPQLNKLLSEIGIGRFINKLGEADRTQQLISMGNVDWSHPIFEGMFEKRKKLNPVFFRSYYQIDESSQSDVIIRLQNGHPLLVGGGRHVKNAYVFATPFKTKWTNLVVRGFVLPLFYRVLYYSSTRSVRERLNVEVGNSYSELFRRLQPPYNFILRRPSGAEEKINTVFKGSDVMLQVEQNLEPGNYEIWQGNQILTMYSVNHSPGESEQQYMSSGDLENYFANFWWINQEDDLLKQIETSRFGRELWPYLLAVVFLLLLVEMILAYTGSKKQSERMKQELAAG